MATASTAALTCPSTIDRLRAARQLTLEAATPGEAEHAASRLRAALAAHAAAGKESTL